jgi:hypothetical protein
METPETNFSSQPAASDMQAQFDALRHLVVSILILVLVISGTFNIYLLRQWRSTSKDFAAIAPQVNVMVAQYQREKPLMAEFVEKLRVYGRSHPEYAVQVLTPFKISTSAPAPAPAAQKK